MTQTELANEAGLSKDAVSTYVRKRSIPGRENLRAIAKALKTDPDQLLPRSAEGDSGQPVALTMLGGNRVRIRIDAEVSLDAATRILALVDAAHAAGGC